MRQCVVIVGSVAQGEAAVPEMRELNDDVLRQNTWYARHEQSAGILLDDVGNVLARTIRAPILLYQCYLYISSVKTWSGKRPLVYVRGKSWSARLAALAAPWAGGDVIQRHDEPGGVMRRARYLLRDDGTFSHR